MLCWNNYYLLGSIGGYMGLLLGASILTILELVDFVFCNLLRRCFHWRTTDGSLVQVIPDVGHRGQHRKTSIVIDKILHRLPGPELSQPAGDCRRRSISGYPSWTSSVSYVLLFTYYVSKFRLKWLFTLDWKCNNKRNTTWCAWCMTVDLQITNHGWKLDPTNFWWEIFCWK